MKFLFNLLCLGCVAYTAYHLYMGEPNPQVQIVEKKVPVVIEREVHVARQAQPGNAARIIVDDGRGNETTVWSRQ